METTSRVASLAAVIGLAVTLSACGAGDKGASGSATTSATASASASAPGGPGGGPGGGNQQQFAAIQQCLQAAGLGDKLPTGVPSGRPSDLPSGAPPSGALPNGGPPSGSPPSGFPAGGAGGGVGQLLSDPEVQAALTACGIDLPSAPAQQG